MMASQCGSILFHAVAIFPDYMNGLLEPTPPSMMLDTNGKGGALTATLSVGWFHSLQSQKCRIKWKDYNDEGLLSCIKIEIIYIV